MSTLQVIVRCSLIVSICTFISCSPIVKIQNGTLEGTYMKSRKGREFFAFRGIPYALPPVGKFRFAAPQPAASWTGVRSAKDDANICLQRDDLTNEGNVEGVEDCLYLNVYTPELPNCRDAFVRTSFPVMVWIHAGGWIIGSSHSAFYNPKFLLDKNIVLVTFNYRLGALAFFSTTDEVVPGNQGLKDQAQVLRWVHENIAAFGGDPNSVTIFGSSAGGASVHHLVLSPLTKGLIHRAISQSGTALSPWALSTPEMARGQAVRLGKDLNCPTDNSERLVACLRTKNVTDIIMAYKKWQIFINDPVLPFQPVIEHPYPGALITEESVKFLDNAKLVDIPWMTGFTSHEGCLKAAVIYGLTKKNYVKQFNDNFLKLAPMMLFYDHSCPKELHDQVSNKIRKFYFDDKAIDESARLKVIDMYTDVGFATAADKTIKEHLKTFSSPVYYYHIAYQGSNSWSTAFDNLKRDYGVCHADDLFYLFPLHEVLPPRNPLSNEDEKMIDVMTTLWYNFAKTGNPTPEVIPELPVKWKPVRTEALEYLLIENSQKMTMSKELFKDRIQFWKNLPCPAGLAPLYKPIYIKDEL